MVSGAGALATLGAELDDLGVERIFLVAGARAGSSVAAAETKDNLGARGIEADLAKVCTSVVAEGPAPNPRPLTRPALEALLTAAWSGDLSGAASR